jgi:hypothetical protein
MKAVVLLVALVAPLGCAETHESMLSRLKTRASFDLQCPKSQIKTVTLDDRTEGVRGCGQQATYVQQCEATTLRGTTIGEDCTWVQNTDAKRRQKSSDDDD